MFVSGPTGTGTQRSTWFGSVDRGHTFRIITQDHRRAERETFVPQTYAWGSEAQVDWYEAFAEVMGELRKVYCFPTFLRLFPMPVRRLLI